MCAVRRSGARPRFCRYASRDRRAYINAVDPLGIVWIGPTSHHKSTPESLHTAGDAALGEGEDVGPRRTRAPPRCVWKICDPIHGIHIPYSRFLSRICDAPKVLSLFESYTLPSDLKQTKKTCCHDH